MSTEEAVAEDFREMIRTRQEAGTWGVPHLAEIVEEGEAILKAHCRDCFLDEIKTRTDNVIRTMSGSPSGNIPNAVHAAVEQVLRVIDGNGDDRAGYSLVPRDYVEQPTATYDIAGQLSSLYFDSVNT